MGNGTSIGRVRGLGSAKTGSHHWLVQRFTAIGNLVLLLWFIASLLMLPNLGYKSVIEWIVRPVPATAMALLVITTIWHAKLGVQVLIEDYVHGHAAKFAALLANSFVTALLGVAALYAILKMSIGL